MDPALHVYLSLSVSSSAAAACLTALEAFVAQGPGRLRGIRDETPGCRLGLAALERFRGRRLEVYTADEDMLAEVVRHGGAGLISPGANLLGRHCTALMQATKPAQSKNAQRAILAVGEVLRSHLPVVVIKTLLARHTGNPTWDKVRLPLRPLGKTDREALFRAFDATGIRLRSAT
jgi:4-hydroxy-tetrahydrodipicolinate synthase